MTTISITSIAETEISVSPNMFGANFLATFYSLEKPMLDLFDSLNITTLRYPGGLVEDSFSIHDPNRTIDDNGKPMIPLLDFLDVCVVENISATILLPTRTLLSNETDENGDRYPNAAEIQATVQFVENIIISYAYLGLSRLLRLIDSFEIGNEYWGSGEMTGTEYGRIANSLVPKIYDSINRILGPQGAEEIDLLVQMGAPWSRDYDEGGRIDDVTSQSAPSILSELGLKSQDFDADGNLKWRAKVDLENRLIISEIETDAKSKIGGLVEHYYLDTPLDYISYSSSNLINIDRDLQAWRNAGFDNTPIHITEWNIQTSNHDQLGLRGGGAFLIQFSFMVQLDVESAFVWPIQHNTITDLAGSVGSVNAYSASGYVFQHLSEHVRNMKLVNIDTDSTEYQVVAFKNDNQAVFYIVSRIDEEREVAIDLQKILGASNLWSAASIEILGVDMSTSDGSHFLKGRRVAIDPFEEHDARGQIEEKSQDDVFIGTVAALHLDPYEIGMLVIEYEPSNSSILPQNSSEEIQYQPYSPTIELTRTCDDFFMFA